MAIVTRISSVIASPPQPRNDFLGDEHLHALPQAQLQVGRQPPVERHAALQDRAATPRETARFRRRCRRWATHQGSAASQANTSTATAATATNAQAAGSGRAGIIAYI